MKLKKSIVETDLDILHSVSTELSLVDKAQCDRVKNALISVFNRLDGKAQGLAAIQCGQPYRAILLRFVKGEEPIVVFNPEVLFKFGSKKSNEGCLSEGDDRYIVKRPILIRVKFVFNDKVLVKWYTYHKARIFMHEYDHLNGVLLQDKGILVKEK